MRILGMTRAFGALALLALTGAGVCGNAVDWTIDSLQSSQAGGEVTEGVQLLIDTDKEVFVHDEPVMVNFRLKNFRPEALNTSTRNSALNDYSIEVIDGSGRRVAARDEDRRKEEEATVKIRYKDHGYRRYLKIQPGDEQSESVDVRDAYSLLPGTYSIRAKRNVVSSDGNGFVTIVSNRIVVTVLE
jgi:hypothetical protein